MEITSIDEIACDIFGITLQELDSKSQKKEVTECKFAIYFFRNKELKMRASTIGRMYGFAPAGVGYGIKKFSKWLEDDDLIKIRYTKFQKEAKKIAIKNIKEKGYKFRTL